MKIVFLDSAVVGDTPLDKIAGLGELVCYPRSTPQEAKERVGDCEVLIINKIKVDRELLDAAPKLKLVCESATGIDNIDVKAAAERGIEVKNVAGYSTDSVAQTTFMHILNLLGRAFYFDETVKSGRYSASGLFTDVTNPPVNIKGRTIGIIGMGTIGEAVASIAVAFGMKVIYYSTSGTSHCTKYPSVPLETLMKEADVISIHCPKNERTNGLIGDKELALMKPDAIIVNMGRGGIIDENALARAIDANRIGGAASDVFVEEPLPADHPLLHTSHPEKLSLSPHIAWTGVDSIERLISAIAENIRSSF